LETCGSPDSRGQEAKVESFGIEVSRLAVSDIALKGELPEAIARSVAAYVDCIAGAIKIDDYRAGLLAAGFKDVEIVDSGADLNAYTKVENQSGCCSPAMDGESCCSPVPGTTTLHTELSDPPAWRFAADRSPG
jgi:arsenite methyltransferase